MSHALSIALRETTLVVFTVLGPMGLAAGILLCAALAGRFSPFAARQRLEHLAVIPTLVTTVGLIGTASHLGTPDNALYVLSGVGRSPLSTEVACVVACLASCGSRWLYSFIPRPNETVQQAWSAVNMVLCSVALATVARAYDVWTVPTWSGTWAACSIVLGGFAAGVPLALLVALLARAPHRDTARRLLALAVGAACMLATVMALAAHWASIRGLATGIGEVAQTAPVYPALIAASELLGASGYAVLILSARRAGAPTAGACVGASMLVAAGMLAARFGFYLVHLTVGMGL